MCSPQLSHPWVSLKPYRAHLSFRPLLCALTLAFLRECPACKSFPRLLPLGVQCTKKPRKLEVCKYMGGEVYGCQAPAMVPGAISGGDGSCIDSKLRGPGSAGKQQHLEDSICKRKQCSGWFSQGVEAQSSGACDSPPESPPFLLPLTARPQRATVLIISPWPFREKIARLRRASKAFFTIPFDTTSKTVKFISASFAPLLAARAGTAGLALEV